MKSKILSGIVTSAAIVSLSSGSALAWNFSMSGSGNCQPDGSYKITWTVNNTTENEPLQITGSSNHSVVAVGDQVPAHQSKNYTQNVDGNKAGSHALSVTGHWNSDRTDRTMRATVNLDQPCAQPQPVVSTTSGRGADVPAQQSQTVSAPAPAVVPVGAVDAGEGGSRTSGKLGYLMGLAGSIGLLVLTARRLNKSTR